MSGEVSGSRGLGWPAPFNPSDFTTAGAALGQWSANSGRGYPIVRNPSDFTTTDGTGSDYVLQVINLSAVLRADIEPFDRVDHVTILDAMVERSTAYSGSFDTRIDAEAVLVGRHATAAAGRAQHLDLRIRARQYIVVCVEGWQSVTALAGPEAQ